MDIELSELAQKPDEALAAYYKRACNLMIRVGARDRPTSLDTTLTLTSLESAFLDTVLRAFTRGILDIEVRHEATRAMASPERSLRAVYNSAEEARRTNMEIKKMYEEQIRHDELHFYKQLAQQNLPKQKIDALLSSYHTSKQKVQGSRWGFFTDSPSFETPQPQQHGSYQPQPAFQSQPPPYTSPAPPTKPVLEQNPNKANAGPPRNAPPPRNQGKQKPLPDRSESRNLWINGSKQWYIDKDGRLCVRCGHVGHIATTCTDDPLPAWEQSYLREIVFGHSAQVSFTQASFGEYDGGIKPYGFNNLMSGALSPSSQSVTFGTAGLSEAMRASAEAYYGEGSGPNKRPHVEEQLPQASQPSQGTLPQQTQPQTQPFQFRSSDDRTKKKGQKRVGKKAEPQPLVGMYNDLLGKYDSPTSVRQFLQDKKIDISLIDLVAWSPAFAKEMKRCLTRVTKKRESKAKQKVPQNQMNPFAQFNPSLIQQLPQQIPSQAPAQGYTFPGPVQGQPQSQPQPQPQPQQAIPNQGQQVPPPPGVVPTSSSATYVPHEQRHTHFLSTMIGVDKAFRIACIIIKPNGVTVVLERKTTQADQGSDMNVISYSLSRRLELELHPLEEIGFKGLSMRTADMRETLLQYWVWLRVAVAGVVRDIRCFVAPEIINHTSSGEAEYLSLILGIPWLYSVDA